MNKNINSSAENGYELVHFCEFDKYAEKSYCAVHGVSTDLNLGDITMVDENSLNESNFFCGGSPCFPAGVKVITINGCKNIEDIHIGDDVLTHKNRYKKVVNIGGEKNKQLFILKAQGNLELKATGYHPFYVKKTRESSPEKIRLSEIDGGFVAVPINTKSIDVDTLTDEICWILGRYVADGHVRKDKRKERKDSYQYQLILSVGKDKVEYVKNKITSYNISCYEHTQSVYRIVISNKDLVNFVIDNKFGTSAETKTIPQFILDLPVNKLASFLDGYMSGDGCEIANSGLYSATTVSESLAISLREAIQKVYSVGCRLYFNKTKDKHIIQGREVNQRDTYIVRFVPDTNRKHFWFIEDNKVWYPIKYVSPTDEYADVYNIEVDEDHTYTANGIVCYNCQDFSISGKQKGSVWTCKECGHEYNPLTVHFSKRDCCPNCGCESLDKSRSSLLVEYLRMIRANKPNFFMYENVKNIVGKKFKTTFDMFVNELIEYGYNVHYKVLNSKDYGVPQNRERVYLIGILKELDNGKFEFPEGFDNGIRLKDVLEPEIDEKFYVTGEKAEKLIQSLIDDGTLIDPSLLCDEDD